MVKAIGFGPRKPPKRILDSLGHNSPTDRGRELIKALKHADFHVRSNGSI